MHDENMKKQLIVLIVSLCTSFAFAQSGNARFIDSPSWILAGNNSGTATGKAGIEAGKSEPASTVVEPGKREKAGHEAAAGAEDKPIPASSAKEPGRRQGEASSRAAASAAASQGGGFLHLGVYLTPMFNWLGSVSEPYQRTGISFCATPTVMLDMRFFRLFYLGVGASFNTVGGKIGYPELKLPSPVASSSTVTVGHSRVYEFSYVEVPVRVKLQTPNFSGSRGSLFLSAGANLGFGVRYKYRDIYENILVQTGDMGYRSGRFQAEGKMREDAKLVNVSVVGQIGYNHQIARRLNLVIGLEYHYGAIQPMKNESGNLLASKPEFHNHQIGIILGIMF